MAQTSVSFAKTNGCSEATSNALLVPLVFSLGPDLMFFSSVGFKVGNSQICVQVHPQSASRLERLRTARVSKGSAPVYSGERYEKKQRKDLVLEIRITALSKWSEAVLDSQLAA